MLFIALAAFSASNTKANENSKYLEAVREFADNVLKYGRDTYGPKHTPLFVDGLNIHTHEPVKWIDPDGTKWVLSNFASQQTLLRTLDGLSSITGDNKYQQAAMDAIKYSFDHLRTPSGIFYWGHITAYDALGDTPRGNTSRESIKLHYPYYELMWTVDPDATKKLIEALWCAHVMDWSNLDFNRIGITTANLEEPWNHEYDEEAPTFFKSKSESIGFFTTATSLIQAGTNLYRLSRQGQPLVWSKRLAKRFIDTRHLNTGISTGLYNTLPPRPLLGDDLKEHFADPHTCVFPWKPFEETRYMYYPENVDAHEWISFLLVGGMLGEKGREFTQWALEELTAWGKASYRKKDNSFVPILTDGTNIEGYVCKENNSYAPKGAIAKPVLADLTFFWGYTVAYRTTCDQFMWEMIRDIALGNNFGDVGQTPAHTTELQTNTACSDVYGLLGFLELYAKTNKSEFLQVAQRIGDNIVRNHFYKGFFVPTKRHIYTRFDCFEPLALLNLHAAIKSKTGSMPQVWPRCPLIVPPYRYKQKGVDRHVIYALTKSPELPLSLQEAAAIGDVNLVSSLLEKGVGVDSWDDPLKKTALQRAAMSGHKDLVELLLAKGARVDAQEDFPGGTALDYAAEKGHKEIAELLIARGANVNAKRGYPAADTPLHSAVRAGHKDIVELLIAKGADINAKNNEGQAPVDIAVSRNRNEVVKLLIAKGVDVSLHVAVRFGSLAKVKSLIEEVADINAKDTSGQTPLQYAAEIGRKEIVEVLLANGADVDARDRNGQTPAESALLDGHSEIIELLISNGADVYPLYLAVFMRDLDKVRRLIRDGADVNKRTQSGTTAIYIAAIAGFRDIAELLIDKGADVNARGRWDWTSLHSAAEEGHRELAELLIAKGANVNARDGGGRTPLWYAEKEGYTEIVELLRKHGAKE